MLAALENGVKGNKWFSLIDKVTRLDVLELAWAKVQSNAQERVADGRMLGLIEAFLKQGVIEGMQSWEAESGTPQGAVISPLLANIYLDPLDWLTKTH